MALHMIMDFWMKENLNGDVDLDITLSSNLLRLEDIFSYGGENYVPEDYRHEEVDHLVLHVNSSMHYKNSLLHSIDIELDKLNANAYSSNEAFRILRSLSL